MKPQRAQLADVLASLRNPALRYADVRYTETSDQHVRVRNGEVENLSSTIDRAIGVRVLVGNGWGFAASSDTSESALRAAAELALEVAAASHIATSDIVVLSDVAPHVANWSSHFEIDPWTIPLAQKIEHLLAATDPIRGDPLIRHVS